MGFSGNVSVLTDEECVEDKCVSTQLRALILEKDPVYRRVMCRLLRLMAFEVSSTSVLGEARQVLRDHPVSLVVVGCSGSDDLESQLKALSLSEKVNLVVVSSQAVSSSTHVFTFVRRPCSWSALRRAIEQNVLFAV